MDTASHPVLRSQPAQTGRVSARAGLAMVAVVGMVFAYAIVVVSATHSGNYGKHLLELLAA